jgi:hypothetical protein
MPGSPVVFLGMAIEAFDAQAGFLRPARVQQQRRALDGACRDEPWPPAAFP